MKEKSIVGRLIIIFVLALAIGVCAQLILTPGFAGLGVDQANPPTVNYLPGDSGSQSTGYNWQDHPVFVIGDSLTQGAANEIEQALGANATVDGLKNRNMSQGLAILKDMDSKGILTDDSIIVVCLAHNITGSTVDDAKQIVDMIRSGQSLVMMTGHGKSDMQPVNDYIRSLPSSSYIAVADWDMTVSGSPGLLADDGIHIRGSQGNEVYANLILKAVEAAKPKP